MTWSLFLKSRDESPTVIFNFIKRLNAQKIFVKYIRLDNSGENRKLIEDTQPFFNIKYKFTAPSTPKHNGRVERKFAILYDYMRSMLNHAKVTPVLRRKLWAESANHATDIINCLCTPSNKVPPHELFYKTPPTYFQHLQLFGTMVVYVDTTDILAKTSDRGKLGLYVGRAIHHTVDTHRILNLQTKHIILSRSVKFMQQMYGDYFNTTTNNLYHHLADYDSDDEIKDYEPDNNNFSGGIPHPQNPQFVNTITPTKTTNPVRNITPQIFDQQEENDDDDVMPELVMADTYSPTNSHESNKLNQPNQFNEQEINDIELEIQAGDTIVDRHPEQINTYQTVTPKLVNEMKRLTGFLNPFASQFMESLSNDHISETSNVTEGQIPQGKDDPPITLNDLETINDSSPEIELDPTNQNPPSPEMHPPVSEVMTERALYTVEPIPSKQIQLSSQIDFKSLPPSQLKDIVDVPTTFNEATMLIHGYASNGAMQSILNSTK